MRGSGIRFVSEKRPDVATIDFKGAEVFFRTGESGDSGKQIDGHAWFMADGSRGDDAWKLRHHRYTDPSFEGRPLALTKAPSGARMIAVGKPWAVVAGEDHKRSIEEVVPLQSRHDFADGPVDLTNHVAIRTIQ